MSWKNINEALENIKERPGIKEGIQLSLLKKFLQKKFKIEDISFQQEKLLIKTKDSLLAQDLNFKKEDLKDELNKALGEQKIKEIIIRVI
jgi:hypothetical protein